MVRLERSRIVLQRDACFLKNSSCSNGTSKLYLRNKNSSCSNGTSKFYLRNKNSSCSNGTSNLYLRNKNSSCSNGTSNLYLRNKNSSCSNGTSKLYLRNIRMAPAKCTYSTVTFILILLILGKGHLRTVTTFPLPT